MRDFVHCIGQFCLGLLCSLYLIKVGFERLSYKDKLVVECVCAIRYGDCSCFIWLGLPLVILQPEVCIDGSTARVIMCTLTIAPKLSKLPVWSYPNVR